jgi:hypothetical protein
VINARVAMRPRKLYHQRIIVITQRGGSRGRNNARYRCCCVAAAAAAAAAAAGWGRRRWRGGQKSRDSRGAFCYYPAGGKCNRSRTNCEPRETVNRGVTRFGEAIYLRAIGYRSPLLLSGKADGSDAAPSAYRVIGPDFQQG